MLSLPHFARYKLFPLSHCPLLVVPFFWMPRVAVHVYLSQEKNDKCIATTHNGGEGVANKAFLSHMSSPTLHIRGWSQVMPE